MARDRFRVLRLAPPLVAAACLAGYVALALAQNQGDVGEMARLGIRRRAGDPAGLAPYDGQFSYFLALDSDPATVARHLDVPAYRYQRILYPLLIRLMTLANPQLIPWALVIFNIFAQAIGAGLMGVLLADFGAGRWYALVYGLWVGLVYAVRLAMPEALAYALVAGALLASQRGRETWAAVLYGLALFTKETTILFIGAHLLWLAARREWPALFRLAALTLLPFGVFQWMLLRWFGRLGLGSGGLLATPFEIIPYMGLWRIGLISLPALALFSAILVPLVVLPSLWGLAASLRRLWRRDWSLPVLVLAANAAFIPFTPHSTFREPLGMARLSVGLVLATLYFGARYASHSPRALNYSAFWLAGLALLLNDPR